MHFCLSFQRISIYNYKNDIKIIRSLIIYQKHLYNYDNL